MHNSFPKIRQVTILIVSLMIATIPPFCQTRKSNREAWGAQRASVIEGVLVKLYPGSQVKWDPELTVEIPGNVPQAVEVAGFHLKLTPSGNFEGATGIELGKIKEQFIHNSKNFRSPDNRNFPTDLVVFRANADGQVTQLSKFALDPSDPLAKIKILEVQEWPGQRLANCAGSV